MQNDRIRGENTQLLRRRGLSFRGKQKQKIPTVLSCKGIFPTAFAAGN